MYLAAALTNALKELEFQLFGASSATAMTGDWLTTISVVLAVPGPAASSCGERPADLALCPAVPGLAESGHRIAFGHRRVPVGRKCTWRWCRPIGSAVQPSASVRCKRQRPEYRAL